MGGDELGLGGCEAFLPTHPIETDSVPGAGFSERLAGVILCIYIAPALLSVQSASHLLVNLTAPLHGR